MDLHNHEIDTKILRQIGGVFFEKITLENIDKREKT